jgi:NAD(P)-dependent dehydrogenase (short-subunit alcohol dehydrogenase family)
MKQKTWFITGAGRGLGRVWAEAALERGDKVAATARDTDSLRDLVDSFGDAILPLKLDVTDRAGVFAAVARAHDHFGRLDVVVNNAGYGLFGASKRAARRKCAPSSRPTCSERSG